MDEHSDAEEQGEAEQGEYNQQSDAEENSEVEASDAEVNAGDLEVSICRKKCHGFESPRKPCVNKGACDMNQNHRG